METYSYVGKELELFQHATQWKAYYARALRPFIADDDHRPSRIGTLTDYHHAVFLALKNQRRPCKREGAQSSHLDQCPVRAEIALEHDQAAVR